MTGKKHREARVWAFRQWRAAVTNEIRQLVRDRVGLILLFLMPAVLVLVITLIQDPLLKQEGGGFRIQGLLVDGDGGPAARRMVQAMSRTGVVEMFDTIGDRPLDEKTARNAVNRGDYQFYLVIPPGLSMALEKRISSEVDNLFTPRSHRDHVAPDLPELTICFDPAIRSSYRVAISGAVYQAAASMETAVTLKYIGREMDRRFGSMGGSRPPSLQLEGFADQRVAIRQTTSGPDPFANLPTSIQQNIPAWALFGMFFIVVPLSTALIRERREGIVDRLKTMPVSLIVVLLGKLTAFTCACMVQFICIVLMGKWILPLMGTDVLEFGDKLPVVALIALCSSLAATGYGILLGSLARTHEQATVIGPVSVVIAAALGGIMVPVFAMPYMMQTLSNGSPLAWAHSAFMILLARGGSLSMVMGRILLLLLFFVITTLIGGLAIGRRHR